MNSISVVFCLNFVQTVISDTSRIKLPEDEAAPAE